MDKLKDKLLKLKEELEKSMKNSGLGGPGSVKAGAVLPSLKPVTSAGKPTGNNSATPSIGISQPSKKDPMKQAQQIQNKDIKDIKMKEAQSAMKGAEMIKFDDNGQWSIDKADDYKTRETAVPGVSEMGIEARRGTGKPALETGYHRVTSPEKHKEMARQMAREQIEQTKRIKPKLVKEEDSEIEKSGYEGYTESDNARRKMNNLSDESGIHSMNRIKRYGGSGPNAVAREVTEMKRKSKNNPVKVYSPEEIAAYEKNK